MAGDTVAQVELHERRGALIYESELRTPENDEFEAAWQRAGRAMREDAERWAREAERPQRAPVPDEPLFDFGDLVWMALAGLIVATLVFGLLGG